MNLVLKNQVEASEKSAVELDEQLMHESRCALISFEVGDLAKSAVQLFRDINEDVERWQNKIGETNGPTSDQLSKLGAEWNDLYQRLGSVFTKTASLIQRVEKIGPEVDGKRGFFKAWRELRGVVCFSLDRVTTSAEQGMRNETRSLGEITRALFDSSNDRS